MSNVPVNDTDDYKMIKLNAFNLFKYSVHYKEKSVDVLLEKPVFSVSIIRKLNIVCGKLKLL